jgi:hypothetical protein
MELWANHDHLPVLASDTFKLPADAHKLVTFLNRALKERGLIFGLRRQGDDFTLTIYDCSQKNLDKNL